MNILIGFLIVSNEMAYKESISSNETHYLITSGSYQVKQYKYSKCNCQQFFFSSEMISDSAQGGDIEVKKSEYDAYYGFSKENRIYWNILMNVHQSLVNEKHQCTSTVSKNGFTVSITVPSGFPIRPQWCRDSE